MLFVGDDWAEAHHDIEIVDEAGARLARRRFPEGIAGIAALHALIADHLGDDDEPENVLVREKGGGGELKWDLAREKHVSGYLVYEIGRASCRESSVV